MQVQFKVTQGKKHTVRHDIDEFYLLDTVPSNWSSDCLVAVRKSAVMVVEEPTYHIGQTFMVDGSKHLLAQVAVRSVALIELKTGNRYVEARSVGYPDKITQAELDSISYGKAKLIS